jgi:RNA polymerase sigma factor (sigma-70 family)
MIEQDDDLWSQIHSVANQVIQLYARELITVEVLSAQMLQEWRGMCQGEKQPSQSLLTRIAVRICSRALCAAWRSARAEERNCASGNLRRYLERCLRNSNYADWLYEDAHAIEDIVQQVFEELWRAVQRNPLAGPTDPASFLKYAQSAVLRHAYAFVEKRQQATVFSLEDREEQASEIATEKLEDDPYWFAECNELQRTLKNAILSLPNQRYRQVLLYTFLAGMEVDELAFRLEVSAQEIYMWRRRALQALRNKPEIMQVLQSWRE